jgi:hypothetical protein
MTARWNTGILLVLVVLAAFLYISVSASFDVPFAEGGMTSFIALAVITLAA